MKCCTKYMEGSGSRVGQTEHDLRTHLLREDLSSGNGVLGHEDLIYVQQDDEFVAVYVLAEAVIGLGICV